MVIQLKAPWYCTLCETSTIKINKNNEIISDSHSTTFWALHINKYNKLNNNGLHQQHWILPNVGYLPGSTKEHLCIHSVENVKKKVQRSRPFYPRLILNFMIPILIEKWADHDHIKFSLLHSGTSISWIIWHRKNKIPRCTSHSFCSVLIAGILQCISCISV